eukprot:8880600-Ditylum_brightwellii.AAC.2
MTPWLKAQSEMPSAQWLQPSGTMTGLAPSKMRMASLANFYHGSSEHTATQTHLNNNKKHFQSILWVSEGPPGREKKNRCAKVAQHLVLQRRWQKKDEIRDTVTQLQSVESILCPVCQWAAIVQRIRTYSGATWDTPISAV